MSANEHFPEPSRAGWLARAQAWLVVSLRFIVVPGWVAAAAYVGFAVPTPQENSANVVNLVPSGAPAERLTHLEAKLFRVPLEADTAVVQFHASGLSAAAQARSVALAASADRRGGALAIPVPNTFGLAPGSRDAGSAIVTYLEYPPALSALAMVRAADTYAQTLQHRSGDVVGITGIIPSEWHEGTLIQNGLALVELATVIAIVVLLGAKFRSFGAPLVTLATVGIANLCADQVLMWGQAYAGVAVPGFLKPMQVALVLGIGTDYCVFFLSAYRVRAAHGEPRVQAARFVSAEITPIVLVGGAILAAGLTSLEVARVSFLRDLGPALGLTVLTTMVVAVTFVPCVVALFGRLLLWPRQASRDSGELRADGRPGRLAAFLTRRPVAAVVTFLVVVGLGIGAAGLRTLRVGFTEITGLPASAHERSAYKSLQRGFSPGMLSPTRVLVLGHNVASDTEALARLQSELAREPGVGDVIGPGDQPLGDRLGLVYSQSGNAARFLVVLKNDPFGAAGIGAVAQLRADLPRLATEAGLGGRHVGVTGDTALAQETTSAMRADVVRIALVVLAVSMILLALFLRAVLAPIILVSASALTVAATLGITSWVFSKLLGYGEVTYYVPYASAVLLVCLGSDYNVFVAGRVWQEARQRPIRAAVAVAAPRAAAAVRTAGLALAASFAALAIIPVRGFRELAFAMTLGVALETFLVRSLLVPSLIALIGHRIAWPGPTLRTYAGRPLADDR